MLLPQLQACLRPLAPRPRCASKTLHSTRSAAVGMVERPSLASSPATALHHANCGFKMLLAAACTSFGAKLRKGSARDAPQACAQDALWSVPRYVYHVLRASWLQNELSTASTHLRIRCLQCTPLGEAAANAGLTSLVDAVDVVKVRTASYAFAARFWVLPCPSCFQRLP